MLTKSSLQVEDGTHELARHTYDEDAWKRLTQYGRRIKTLNISTNSSISPALLDHLKDIIRKRPPSICSLLPNIQKLDIHRWPEGDEGVLDVVGLSLGRTANLSSLSFTSGATSISEFIENFLTENLENLHELEVCFYNGFDNMQGLDHFLKILVQSKKLRKLVLPHTPIQVNANTESYLAPQTPELRYLSSILTGLPDASSKNHICRSPMLFLNELDLGITFRGAIALCSAYFPQLKTLKIYSEKAENVGSLGMLSNYIRDEMPLVDK